MKFHRFLPSAAGAACALAALVGPSAASAATVPAAPSASSATACTPATTTKAFAKIDGDQSDYSLAPGGDFENGAAGWTFTGGARIMDGNESRGVAAGKKSLRMPVGSIATSPKFCVDETYPHFRFAYKVDNLGFAGFVAMVVFQKDGITTSTQLISSEKLSVAPQAWSITPKSPLATLIPLQGGKATVQIKLLSVSLAGKNDVMNGMANVLANPASLMANVGVTVDSVMVDPYRRS